MSVKHHEELSLHIRESEWLKYSLLECSNALHEAIGLLRNYVASNNNNNNNSNNNANSGYNNSNISGSGHNSNGKNNSRTPTCPKYVLESMNEDELEAHSALTSLSSMTNGYDYSNEEFKDIIPKTLIAAVAKYNVENIANYCKSSVRVPSADEQLSFLSKVRNLNEETSTNPNTNTNTNTNTNPISNPYIVGAFDQSNVNPNTHPNTNPTYPGQAHMQNPYINSYPNYPYMNMNYNAHPNMGNIPSMSGPYMYNPHMNTVPYNPTQSQSQSQLGMGGMGNMGGMGVGSVGYRGTEQVPMPMSMPMPMPTPSDPLTNPNTGTHTGTHMGALDAPAGTMRLIESLMNKALSTASVATSTSLVSQSNIMSHTTNPPSNGDGDGIPPDSGISSGVSGIPHHSGYGLGMSISSGMSIGDYNDDNEDKHVNKKRNIGLGMGIGIGVDHISTSNTNANSNTKSNINHHIPAKFDQTTPGAHLILNTSMAAVSSIETTINPNPNHNHNIVPTDFNRLLHRDPDGHFTLMPPKSVLNSASELKS